MVKSFLKKAAVIWFFISTFFGIFLICYHIFYMLDIFKEPWYCEFRLKGGGPVCMDYITTLIFSYYFFAFLAAMITVHAFININGLFMAIISMPSFILLLMPYFLGAKFVYQKYREGKNDQNQ